MLGLGGIRYVAGYQPTSVFCVCCEWWLGDTHYLVGLGGTQYLLLGATLYLCDFVVVAEMALFILFMFWAIPNTCVRFIVHEAALQRKGPLCHWTLFSQRS